MAAFQTVKRKLFGCNVFISRGGCGICFLKLPTVRAASARLQRSTLLSSWLHRTTVSSPDASKRSRAVCEIPGNGSSPHPHTPLLPSFFTDALISELAGFYCFLEEFFRSDNSRPCLQPLAMATGVAVAARLRGGSSIVPPRLYTHTHTHRDVLSLGALSRRRINTRRRPTAGGRHSYLRLGISPLAPLLTAASHGALKRKTKQR